MSTASEPATKDEDALALLASPGSYAPFTASVDFAHLVGDRLVAYGWILGFAKRLHRAFIQLDNVQVDLSAYSRSVRRPDVSQHFSVAPGEEHGFYVLADMRGVGDGVDSLLLSLTLPSGETYESRWTVQRHNSFLFSLPLSDLTTLRGMMRSLPALDRVRLGRFLSQESSSGQELEVSTRLPPEIQFEVDLCCVLDEHILVVYGWLLDPSEVVTAAELGIGHKAFDILNAATSVPRLDIEPELPAGHRARSSRSSGFILVEAITEELAGANEAVFAITAEDAHLAYLARPLIWNVYKARREISTLIGKMDVSAGMLLLERILFATRELSNMHSLREVLEENHDRLMERLPPSIQYTSQRSRCWLHLDHAIPVASNGIFLAGWSYGECDLPVTIFCHCGDSSVAISANWIRHTRPDVTTYLETAGIHANDHEHGFTCYVPIHCGDRPYWLAMVSEPGEERRMRVPAPGHKKSALQTVRDLLGAFHCDHRQLRTLMERQIGPSVEAAWSARQKPPAREVVERFGAVSVRPEVSIIVPLFGRWDFAEYQMSQFVNDESFQDIDLIYVVDDPSIYDRFRAAAPNLFGIYGIPFTVAFSGSNLGYAGANNFGASYARGIFILLLNSDVFPKRPGWLRDLVEIYETLSLPGLLGVKLLYEDGTVQHAGIEFKRHAPWGGMWINDHPLKGQFCPELKGVREAAAVTGACALIEADLYRELDGLCEDYIVGDFEDSDLCLRARQTGRKNYVALDVELYHLERQSQNRTGNSLWRSNLTAYNCWLHNKRWASEIEEIVTAESASASSKELGKRVVADTSLAGRYATGRRT